MCRNIEVQHIPSNHVPENQFANVSKFLSQKRWARQQINKGTD